MIEPTEGRVVLYTPAEGEVIGNGVDRKLAAQIAYVNEDGTINIGLLDKNGNHHSRQNVQLLQPDDNEPEPLIGGYASWMPYQIDQSKKGAASTLISTDKNDVAEVEKSAA